MSLEGSLKDFSTFDIMELIGIKRKVGLLFVSSGKGETITLGFENKGLVLAASSAKHLYTQLGTLLIKSGCITEQQRDKTLELQKGTEDPFGYILCRENYCTAEDICLSLHLQMKRTFFTLLRWTEGKFRFESREPIEYFHKLANPILVRPINVQGLLMEGAVMIDEWPIVENVVKSRDMVFIHLPISKKLQIISEDAGIRFYTETETEVSNVEDVIEVTSEEESIYNLIDGHKSVNDVLYRTPYSEFICYMLICGLVKKGLIEASSEARSAPGEGEQKDEAGLLEVYNVEAIPKKVEAISSEDQDKDIWEAARVHVHKVLPSANVLEMRISDKKTTCLQGTSDVLLWSDPISSILKDAALLEEGSQVGVVEYVANKMGVVLFWDRRKDYILVVSDNLSGSGSASRFRSQVAGITRIILD